MATHLTREQADRIIRELSVQRYRDARDAGDTELQQNYRLARPDLVRYFDEVDREPPLADDGEGP